MSEDMSRHRLDRTSRWAVITPVLRLGATCPAGAQPKPVPQPQDTVVCKLEGHQETPECLQRLKGLTVKTGDTLRLNLTHFACGFGLFQRRWDHSG